MGNKGVVVGNHDADLSTYETKSFMAHTLLEEQQRKESMSFIKLHKKGLILLLEFVGWTASSILASILINKLK